MENVQMIPVIRLCRSKALFYQQPDFDFRRSEKQRLNEVNLRDISYNGFMSPKTRSKVSLFLTTWVDAIEEQRITLNQGKYFRNSCLTFVTLTLSAKQRHNDNYIKRNLLTRFITESKRKFQVHNYFWRAESQKNGNIHFHLLIDKYVHWSAIRALWNSIQSDHGYIDEFENLHGHRNPNSTDIQGLADLKNVAAYLIKYCCKKDGFRKIDGRIWGASDSVKLLRPLELIVDNELHSILVSLENNKEVRVHKQTEFVIFGCNIAYQLSKISPSMYSKYKDYYLNIYKELYVDFKVSECVKIRDIVNDEIDICLESTLQGNINFAEKADNLKGQYLLYV